MSRLTLPQLNTVFNAVSLVIFAIFLGFAGTIAFIYGDFLTGNFRARAQTELLTGFNASRFDASVQRLQRRLQLPDPDPKLPNPFGIPRAR